MPANTDFPALLDEFETATRDQRLSDAATLLNEFVEGIQGAAVEEATVANRAVAVQEVLAKDDDRRETVDEYVMQSSGLDGSRASFVLSASSALLKPEEVGLSDLVEQTQRLSELEREHRSLRGPVEEVLDAVDIPAHIAVLKSGTVRDIAVAGAPLVLETTIGNVGDAEAEAVEVELDLPEGLSANRSRVDVGSLGGESQVVLTFELQPEAADTYDIDIHASSSNAGDRLAKVQTEVVSYGSLLERILQRIVRLNEQVHEDVSRKGQREALSANLDTARSRVERAIEFYANGRDKQTDNMLRTASRNLGALLHKLDANTRNRGKGKGGNGNTGIDDRTAFQVRTEATDIVDLIAYARDTLV